MNALIVADGDIPSRDAVWQLLGAERPDIVVAADAGALKSALVGIAPDVVVGDADSLGPDDVRRLQQDGTIVVVHPTAKDESDTQLALLEAVARGATDLLVIGAFGGRRIEHTVANLLLLCLPELRGLDVRLADDRSTIQLLEPGEPIALRGQAGDFVSLLPLTADVDGVTTDGLEFPLDGEPLPQGPARGLSNRLTAHEATVSARSGRVLVIHTRGAQ